MSELRTLTPKNGTHRASLAIRKKTKAAVVKAVKNVPDLTAQLTGLYERVAHDLKIEVQFVRRIALGEMYSPAVEQALKRELIRIVKSAAQDSRHD